MSHGIFIIGTDTGVGKTVVTAGILRWLREQRIDAVPMKPVQTGGKRRKGRLAALDLEFCLLASELHPGDSEIQLMSPYVFEPACSPHLAGRMARQPAEPALIKDCSDKLLKNHHALIVEGAGGIMAPLNENATMLDLIKVLGFPVVLVSRFGLGTINHTLMSIQTLRASGIMIIGVVFNHTEISKSEDCLIEEDNPNAIARFGNIKVLGKVRYLSGLKLKNKDAWKLFEEDMPGLKNIYDELRV